MVRWMRGVGGMFEMCMCLARGVVGGERFGFYQYRGTCLCLGFSCVGGVSGEWVMCLGQCLVGPGIRILC